MQSGWNSTVNLLFRNIKQEDIPMGQPNVVEAIGDDYKQKWNSKNPVFIDAPTGTGKTTLVYDKLIPYALSKNRSILLVSNRIALSIQQKEKVAELLKKYVSGLDLVLPKDISQYHSKEFSFLGPVCVVTYQGLFSLLNDPPSDIGFLNWSQSLLYAVFDEVHFLYSDAQFNPICGYLLRKIPTVFNSTIRIYMTATSWDVLDLLLDAEQNVHQYFDRLSLSYNEYRIAKRRVDTSIGYTINRYLYRYYTKADYTPYRLHFFDETQYIPSSGPKSFAEKATRKQYLLSLVNLIQQSHVSTNNKWLIFVDKKSSGIVLKKILKHYHIKTAYIDAQSKRSTTTAWETLLATNAFEESVLIATSVIECGVNIKDPAVKNIAIFNTDHTSFIQMLGRRRLDSKTDKTPNLINIWVWNPSTDYFKNIEKHLLMKIKLANQLNSYRTYYHQDQQRYVKLVRKIWADKNHFDCHTLFYIDNSGLLSVDYYVWSILEHKLEFIQNFTRYDNPLRFQDVVEEWLGIPGTLAPSMQTKPVDTPKSTADLSTLLENNIDTKISDNAFKPIRRAILAVQPDTMDYYIRPERRENCSAKTLNRILEYLKLPYSIKKQAKLWTISRIQSDN